MEPKQRAAEAAIEHLRDGMVIGLGTGSTADYFLRALGLAIRQSRLRGIQGVPTSLQSERRAREVGIPLATLAECPRPDVTVDGADEIDPQLNLIKGLGGALLREKIVAQNSRRLIIIADAGKVVPALGTRVPLPVEVAKFGFETHEAFFRSLGAEPALRYTAEGQIFVTDNGNVIYDCRFRRIDDPPALEARLHARAGIVETGLFLGLATLALIGHDDRVEAIGL